MNHKTLKDTVIVWDMACKSPTPTGAQSAEKADAFYPPEQREKDLKPQPDGRLRHLLHGGGGVR